MNSNRVHASPGMHASGMAGVRQISYQEPKYGGIPAIPRPPLGMSPGHQIALKHQHSLDDYAGARMMPGLGGGPQRNSDVIQVRTRGKNNHVQTRTGSVTQTMGEMETKRKQKRELSHATKRLKVLEQIEDFREKKIAQEMMLLEAQRKDQEEKMLKQLDVDRKKQKYLEKQKSKVAEFQQKKQADVMEKHRQDEKERKQEEARKKKQAKEQEMKKKQIAEYKRKKLEAEEMLANADLLDYEEDDYEDYNHLNNNAFNDYKLSSKNSFGNESGTVPMGGKTGPSRQQVIATSGKKNHRPIQQDEEDQFLDDIINRNS